MYPDWHCPWHYPKPPRRVRWVRLYVWSYHHHRRIRVYNVTASWAASAPGPGIGAVTGYNVAWTRNGAPAATVTTTSLAADFNSGNPGITLASGDVIDCTVTAADTTDNLLSPPDTATPVTIPTPLQPPAPVTNLTLTVTGP